MQTPRPLAAALLVLACTPKSADTDGGSFSSSSSGAQTDGAEATSATNTSPTTGVDPTTPQTGTSASDDTGPITTGTTGTTSTGTSDTGTDDTGDGGLLGACEAAFARLDACDPGSLGRPDGEWIEHCNAVPFEALPECFPALVARWSCIAALSCEEAKKFQAGEPTSCSREVHAADVACVDQGCSGEGGGSGETCQHAKVCNGLAQGIVCEADVCTCTEHNVPVGECPADGLCDLGPDEQAAAIHACCGWTP